MRTPKEFAQEVSPTKDGMRHQLELMHLDKHIYEWMRRYAIEYYESEVLKLNKANVIKSVCDKPKEVCGFRNTEGKCERFECVFR